MIKLYAFYINNEWGYVEAQESIPADATQSFEATIADLSPDEEEWFSSDCLIYDGANQTVTFDHSRFNSKIRNKVFIDKTSVEGQKIDWLDRRSAAYPSIGDQLDMIYRDQLSSSTEWRDAIAAAKAATPKIGA